jgi:transcription elongation factor Elf1
MKHALPPLDTRDLGLPERVACPFCEQQETEILSLFGTALSVATYWCRRCRTAFEWIR